jgi:hypothetical protein
MYFRFVTTSKPTGAGWIPHRMRKTSRVQEASQQRSARVYRRSSQVMKNAINRIVSKRTRHLGAQPHVYLPPKNACARPSYAEQQSKADEAKGIPTAPRIPSHAERPAPAASAPHLLIPVKLLKNQMQK